MVNSYKVIVHNTMWENELYPLIEEIAEYFHEEWVKKHIAEGWTYSPIHDVINKTTPALVIF